MPDTSFPITTYDRGSIALANLLKGNVDASTRAIFAPMELSPDEVKTVRKSFLKGKAADSPLIKTAVDLGTNPLVIMGLIMALGPWGKIAGPANMLEMMKAGGKEMPKIFNSSILRGILSPFTSLRTLWKHGLLDGYSKFAHKLWNFTNKGKGDFANLMDDFIQSNGMKAMTTREDTLVAMFAEGLHTAKSPLKTQWVGKGGFGKNDILAPDLLKHMTPQLKRYADKYKSLIDKYGIRTLKPDLQGKVTKELAAKGVVMVPEGFFHRVTHITPQEVSTLKNAGLSPDKLRIIASRAGQKGFKAGATKARMGNSLPLINDLESAKDVLAPGVYNKIAAATPAELMASSVDDIVSIEGKNIFELKTKLMNMANSVRGMSSESVYKGAKGVNVSKDQMKLLTDAFQGGAKKARLGMRKELIAHGIEEKAANTLASDIINAATQGGDEVALNKSIGVIAQLAGAPARYGYRATNAASHYINTMGPTYAWYSTGVKETFDNVLAHADGFQKKTLDEVIPMLRGLKHPSETTRTIAFNSQKESIRTWLRTSPVSQKFFSSSQRSLLMEKFGDARGSLTESSLGGKIASAFYTSTLGGNLSPTSKNLLQNFVTTLNLMGPKNMAAGLGQVAGRSRKMATLMSKGVKTEIAFKRSFPEYVRAFGHEGIVEAMTAGDIMAEGRVATKMASSVLKKAHKALMVPFATSEKFNRLTAFYSARAGGITDGLSNVDATSLGQYITMFTQFPGGVMNQPNVLRGMNPMYRQFMHFPLKFVEFLYGSTRFGPDGARSLGTLGRGMAGSAGLYTIAKNMVGADISSGLMFSALPNPTYEGSPFYPFPLVPPAVGIPGEVAKSVFTGEYKGLMGKMSSIILPGGLAARRMITSWSPKYADYKNRGADGSIPIYNDKGFLISRQTPMKLALRGMGLKPASIAEERDMTQWLLKQREQLRTYRREYLQAVSQNDLTKARKINDEFKKRYPDLGDIQIKKGDIRTLQNRRQLTRIQRIMKGFPKDYKPLFETITEQAGQAQLAEDIEFNPSGLEAYLQDPAKLNPTRDTTRY